MTAEVATASTDCTKHVSVVLVSPSLHIRFSLLYNNFLCSGISSSSSLFKPPLHSPLSSNSQTKNKPHFKSTFRSQATVREVPVPNPLSLLFLVAFLHVGQISAIDAGHTEAARYMHDILGGSSPTARPITSLLGNIYIGQVPFARPIGFTTPKGGVAIPNANGALPTVNGNNGMIPMGTGLSGANFAPSPGVHTQLGPDGIGLGFGTITIIDDVLTMGPELGSQAVGRAQGFYVARSTDGTMQMMAFTAMIEGGEYGDSLSFFGVYKIGSAMSHLSVTGGSGKFKNASGFAENHRSSYRLDEAAGSTSHCADG